MTPSDERPAERDVRLEIDARWLELQINEDVRVDRWARTLVDDALAARQVSEPKAKRRIYADMYEQLLGVLRASADEPDMRLMTAYCYVPDNDLLYAAMAKLVALALPPGATLDDAVASVIAPVEDRYGDALVTEMDTASGPCVRVQQLMLDPERGGESGVTSSLAYLWPTQADAVFLVLAATFASPIDGGLHEQALDELAATLVKGTHV